MILIFASFGTNRPLRPDPSAVTTNGAVAATLFWAAAMTALWEHMQSDGVDFGKTATEAEAVDVSGDNVASKKKPDAIRHAKNSFGLAVGGRITFSRFWPKLAVLVAKIYTEDFKSWKAFR